MEAALDPSRELAAPRSRDGLGIGAVLALLVHLLLIVAIAFGVSWRTRETDGVVAELWSAVPQTAAPRATSPPPAPAPTPPRMAQPPRPTPPVTDSTRVADAQIAIEKARRESEAREAERRQLEAKRQAAREEAEREQAEREKARQKAAAEQAKRELAAKEEAQRKKEAAEKERREEVALAAQRDAFLKRMQGQAAAGGEVGGTAAQTSGPSASYAGRIRARIKPNIVFTDEVDGNPTATVEVRCAPDGTIVSRKLVKGSGLAAWDEAVLRAIDKTEKLPTDVDGRVPSPMQIAFRPRD